MKNTCLFVAGKVDNEFVDRKINFAKVGLNTGNMLFWYALNNILDLDQCTVAECKWGKVNTTYYDSFVTTDLIWITEGTEYPIVRNQLEIAGDRPLIPISIGLQNGNKSSNFKMHLDTVKLLSELQERCVLGVRGQYTAEILNKYGIKNLQVIGCPSMYLPFDYNFKIRKTDVELKNVSCNMRTLYSPLKKEEQKFLVYSANRRFNFCEQTEHPFSLDICKDVPSFNYLNKWLNTSKQIFFNVDMWRKYMSAMDFSIGCRFHGNVVALWERKPALFITIDSRTTELCEFFNLPTMKLDEFDFGKDIKYYYDLADFSKFNSTYAKKLDGFITFLKRNQLKIKLDHSKYYDLRIEKL